jgi:hypothetical protein
MVTLRYEACTYDGGFRAMKASRSVTLELTDTQFSVRRPRSQFARTARRLWAKWTAVTVLSVVDDPAGARIELTTKAQGTGVIVVPGESADALWAALDEFDGLPGRFHRGATADEAAEPATDDVPAGPDIADTTEGA